MRSLRRRCNAESDSAPAATAQGHSFADDSTAAWMERFYRELKAGKGKAEAKRQAEISHAHRPAHRAPAPFVLIGDWR